jgi:hypothetical protein
MSAVGISRQSTALVSSATVNSATKIVAQRQHVEELFPSAGEHNFVVIQLPDVQNLAPPPHEDTRNESEDDGQKPHNNSRTEVIAYEHARRDCSYD